MSSPTAQILVIRGGAIGDFIVTLPVLAALRRQFPEARIELVAYERVARLAIRSGLADGWRPIESRGLASYFARRGVLEPEWQDYFAKFPLILSYLFDPDEIFRDNVERAGRVQFFQAPHRPDEKSAVHATEQLLKPLERLAIFDADPVPRLTFPDSPEPGVTGPRPIALHPGSGSEAKNWPVARWQDLAARLVAATDHPFLLVGGEADERRMGQVAAMIPEARQRTVFHRPLVEVAGELSRARFFVGHDSGITHLAAALGLDGTALWGPSNELVWRPRGERIRLLHHPAGLAALPVDSVLQAVLAAG